MIEHGKNGLLADFFDIEGLTDQASAVLDAPQEFKYLGANGVEMIRSQYSLEVCIPPMLELYLDAIQGRLPNPSAQRGKASCHQPTGGGAGRSCHRNL